MTDVVIFKRRCGIHLGKHELMNHECSTVHQIRFVQMRPRRSGGASGRKYNTQQKRLWWSRFRHWPVKGLVDDRDLCSRNFILLILLLVLLLLIIAGVGAFTAWIRSASAGAHGCKNLSGPALPLEASGDQAGRAGMFSWQNWAKIWQPLLIHIGPVLRGAGMLQGWSGALRR